MSGRKDRPERVQQDVSALLLAQPDALGLTADQADRVAAWLAGHRGLPPGWALVDMALVHVDRRFQRELRAHGWTLAAYVAPHVRHLLDRRWTSECEECVAMTPEQVEGMLDRP